MAGFGPVGSLVVASLPDAGGAVNYNVVNPGTLLLEFVGYGPTVTNDPGLQVETFSLYIAGLGSPELQVEQYGAYAVSKSADPDLQVEQFGSYIIGQVGAPFQVEQYGIYVVGAIISTLQIEGYSLYAVASEVPPVQIEQYGAYIVARSTPLVIPALAGTVPETPINESWLWLSDRMVSEDGSEQRISLRNEPRRAFSNSYMLTGGNEIRLAKQQLYAAFREEVAVPLYVYQTRLKAVVAAGASYLTFNPVKTDLRDGGWVLVVEDDTYELKVITTLDGTGCNLSTPLAHAYTKRAKVMPVAVSVIDDKTALVQFPGNEAAKLTLKSDERTPVVPFLRPGTANDLTLFNGLPVLERRAIGTEFNDVFENGRTTIDWGGKAEDRISWNFTQFGGNRDYLCNRILEPDEWDYFKTFFDYCKGTVNPFYVPTWREDFDIVVPALISSNTFTVSGHTYGTDYFGNPALKQIAIFADAGVHYASIDDCDADGANDLLTFNPPLPGDAAWESNQAICLLLRCRLGTDQVDLEHQALHTVISTAIRTIDV
jgi:hypothetical protein